MNTNKPIRMFAAILLMTVSLTGCGGGGATMEARTTTTGQELIDLDKAHKAGLITDKEFEKQKDEIMDR